MIGRSELRWDFSTVLYCIIIFYIKESWAKLEFFSLLRDASDIHRFQTVHMVDTHFPLENLWISEASLSKLEKFQFSSTRPYIKLCSIILESIVLGIYFCFKIYFLIDTNTKIWTEITDLFVLGRNFWSSCRCDIAGNQVSPCDRITITSSTNTILRILYNFIYLILQSAMLTHY